MHSDKGDVNRAREFLRSGSFTSKAVLNAFIIPLFNLILLNSAHTIKLDRFVISNTRIIFSRF